MEHILNLPVYVANNADAGAIGEYYFGQGQDSRLLLYWDFGVGVGGGIVMEGQLFRGSHGVAGELGHMVVLENGPECSCGRWGCFETLTSTRALFRRAGARRPDFVPSLSAHDIYQTAEAQESWAWEAIQETHHYVKRGVVNSANMLDVDAVFLGGPLNQLDEYLLDAVKDALDAELLVWDHRHPVVRLATFEEEAGAVGAAALVFSDALRRPRPDMEAGSVLWRHERRSGSPAAHLDALDRSGNL